MQRAEESNRKKSHFFKGATKEEFTVEFLQCIENTMKYCEGRNSQVEWREQWSSFQNDEKKRLSELRKLAGKVTKQPKATLRELY